MEGGNRPAADRLDTFIGCDAHRHPRLLLLGGGRPVFIAGVEQLAFATPGQCEDDRGCDGDEARHLDKPA
jgi:hypothetical protein